MEGLERIVKEHPFFASFGPQYTELLTGCARNHRFAAGEYLFREGEPAEEFFLIRHGKVALEIAAPGKAPVVFETLSDGEVAGASWMVAPYRWMFDARAVTLTRAIGMNATCLRGKCDGDHSLGYEMMKSVLSVLVKRLDHTRLQIVDVYGRG
jgi:CRP/FNR family transcriptional regulator, cyclic AMP receptor protein